MGSLGAAAPRFAGHALTVAEWSLAGPLQVAVVTGEASDPRALALLAAARHGASPGAVVAYGRPDAEGWPLLADRPLIGGAPVAYVCRGFVCDAPVTDTRRRWPNCWRRSDPAQPRRRPPRATAPPPASRVMSLL